MPTPSYATPRIAVAPAPSPDDHATWRCSHGSKLLGLHRPGYLHIRFARGHDYCVGYPAVATCRGCGSLNRTSGPTR